MQFKATIYFFLIIGSIVITLSLLYCTKDENADTASYRAPEAIQYLIDEPVSILDWGFYKINKELENYFLKINKGSANELHASIDYNIAESKIQISLVGDAKDLNEAKEVCVINTNRIREKFGINAKTGEIDPLHRFRERFGISEGIKHDSESSFLYLFFEHSGWNYLAEDESYKPIPVRVRQDLDALTTIKSTITYKNNVGSFPSFLECRAALVGKKILGEAIGDESSKVEVIYE